MFERFTDRARRVVVLAQEAAIELGHGNVMTEHVLLGLIGAGGGVAYVVLNDLGVTYDETRQCIVERCGTGKRVRGHIPFSPRVEKAMNLALREALQIGCNYIGTEHILLAVLRDAESLAVRTLVDQFGLEPDTVRQAVMLQLDSYAGQGSPAAEGASLQMRTIEERDHTGALLGRHHVVSGLRHAPEVRVEPEELHELLPLLEQICTLPDEHREGTTAEGQIGGM